MIKGCSRLASRGSNGSPRPTSLGLFCRLGILLRGFDDLRAGQVRVSVSGDDIHRQSGDEHSRMHPRLSQLGSFAHAAPCRHQDLTAAQVRLLRSRWAEAQGADPDRLQALWLGLASAEAEHGQPSDRQGHGAGIRSFRLRCPSGPGRFRASSTGQALTCDLVRDHLPGGAFCGVLMLAGVAIVQNLRASPEVALEFAGFPEKPQFPATLSTMTSSLAPGSPGTIATIPSCGPGRSST